MRNLMQEIKQAKMPLKTGRKPQKVKMENNGQVTCQYEKKERKK